MTTSLTEEDVAVLQLLANREISLPPPLVNEVLHEMLERGLVRQDGDSWVVTCIGRTALASHVAREPS